MIRQRWAATMVAFVAATAAAQEPKTMRLWKDKAPGETGVVGPERVVAPKEGEKNPVMRITDVVDPTISVYRPAKTNDAGTAVVIAPGGGYNILAWEHEGTQVATWLQKAGATAVLLKYRVPRRPDQAKDKPPVGALQDAQRAVSLVRHHAKEWGVAPERIGMLGFSAGGHLTAWTSTNFDKRSYEPSDAADQVSCRPDFAVLVYAGGIVGKTNKDEMNPEIRVSAQTPPSFLVHAADDPVAAENSIHYTLALRKAGVPAELHLFGSGGHGFGMRPIDHPVAQWPQRCEEWMRKRAYLK